MSIENNLKKWLLENNPKLNKGKIHRKYNGERNSHLRFYNGCGISTLEEFLQLFSGLEILPNDEYTGSPTYKGRGFDVHWNNNKVGVLLGIPNEGHIERKRHTPKALLLDGYTTNNIQEFRNKIIEGLNLVEPDDSFRECLISMLDNIEGKTKIIDHPLLKSNINKITSDFGEVLCAYKVCLDGARVEFPVTSNNPLADFYANGIAYSAKGRNAGGKVNLSEFKHMIDLSSDSGKFLHGLASYNRDTFFDLSTKICKEAKLISDWVGGTSVSAIKNYIKTVQYDTFYAKVEESFEGLGIPDKTDQRPRDLWACGSTEPFYFTLNTIVHRFWGTKETDAITEVVSSFLNKATFIHIDIQDLNVIIKERPFENVEKWQTSYWSRSTKAWHNWMGVQPIEKTE